MNRTATIIFGVGVFVIGVLAVATAQFPQSAPLSSTEKSVQLTGVNVAGADFAGHVVPGVHGTHYFYPAPSTLDYYAAKGMNIIRLPVLWERLQRQLQAKLDETEMRRVDAAVKYATAKKLMVIIDIHNYAKYFQVVIGSPKLPPEALGDLWEQIATRYKDNELVVFGLMNEPVGLRTETWLEAANIAIDRIRRTGAKQLILVPGTGWTSAHGWTGRKYGTPNSVVMLNVVDPANNNVFDIHQYFDRDFSGTHRECQSANIGVASLKTFTQWARDHRKRGFLGEFGAGSSQTCLDALDRTLNFMAENNDVWLGWAYWAGGAWWTDDFFMNIEPHQGRDRPQMTVLEKYIKSDPATRGSAR